MTNPSKFLVHIAPSVLHPKEWFIFYQTKEGAEKERRDTEGKGDLGRFRPYERRHANKK